MAPRYTISSISMVKAWAEEVETSLLKRARTKARRAKV